MIQACLATVGTTASQGPNLAASSTELSNLTPPYAACFEQIAHRRGRKIATIAIARKLLTHAYPVLREVDAAQQKEPCTTA